MRASSILTLTLCAPLLLASSALGLKVWLPPPTLSNYNQLRTSMIYIFRGLWLDRMRVNARVGVE